MKKTAALLLALLLALAPALCPAEEAPDTVYAVSDAAEDDPGTRIDPGEMPAYVERILDIARGELGYVEGPGNYSKYGEWHGDAHAAWCAEFVCWCVHRADEEYGTSLLEEKYPLWGGQNVGRNWFLIRGRFVYRKGNCPDWGYQWLRGDDHYLVKNEYIPRPGDLMFFSYNEAGDTEHVALVEYCARNASGEVTVHVLEGNNPDRVQRNAYLLDNSQILGFGLPEDRVDTVMRLGNKGDKVLVLQTRLHDLGYLAEKHLTGGFGSNTKQAVIAFQKAELGRSDANGIVDRQTNQAIEALWLENVDDRPETWLVED